MPRKTSKTSSRRSSGRAKSKAAQLAKDRKKFAALTKPAIKSSDVDRMTSRMRRGGDSKVRGSAARGRAVANLKTAERQGRVTPSERAAVKKMKGSASQDWDRYGLNYGATLGSAKARQQAKTDIGTGRVRRTRKRKG